MKYINTVLLVFLSSFSLNGLSQEIDLTRIAVLPYEIGHASDSIHPGIEAIAAIMEKRIKAIIKKKSTRSDSKFYVPDETDPIWFEIHGKKILNSFGTISENNAKEIVYFNINPQVDTILLFRFYAEIVSGNIAGNNNIALNIEVLKLIRNPSTSQKPGFTAYRIYFEEPAELSGKLVKATSGDGMIKSYAQDQLELAMNDNRVQPYLAYKNGEAHWEDIVGIGASLGLGIGAQVQWDQAKKSYSDYEKSTFVVPVPPNRQEMYDTAIRQRRNARMLGIAGGVVVSFMAGYLLEKRILKSHKHRNGHASVKPFLIPSSFQNNAFDIGLIISF